MLSEIIEKNHFKFVEKCESWQDAIRKSCETIVADDSVEIGYAERIIKTVEEYGPYIVLAPMIAMPHSQENAVEVKKTVVSFMKVEEAVVFKEDDRDYDAKLFFTIASKDPDIHIRNITRLSEIFLNEELIEDLLKVKNVEELNEIAIKYNL